MERIFQSWSGLASHFIGECFDQAKPFLDRDFTGLDPLVRFVVAQLYIDCHLSSESVLLLARDQKEWDADLVTRAVMEGTIKLIYMLHGTSEEQFGKANEYWNVLPLFSAIKHSDRARRLLNEIGKSDDPHPQWKPYRDLLMADTEVAEIRKNYSRQKRKELEEAWSFSGICKWFATSQDSGLRRFAHLAHGYGMSSHLLHKDADGIGMVWERYGRTPENQDAVKLGHTSRIVSDVCSFAQMRLCFLLLACKQPIKAISIIEERYEDVLFKELTKAGAHFTRIEYGADSSSIVI